MLPPATPDLACFQALRVVLLHTILFGSLHLHLHLSDCGLKVDPLIFNLEMVGIELLDGEVFVLDLSGLRLQKLCNRVVDRNTWVKAPKRTFLAMVDRRGLFNFLAIPDERADALLRRSECAFCALATTVCAVKFI